MERYSEIKSKIKREIVLLKSFPCIWSKCTFCDYIEDNSTCEEEIIQINKEVLKKPLKGAEQARLQAKPSLCPQLYLSDFFPTMVKQMTPAIM